MPAKSGRVPMEKITEDLIAVFNRLGPTAEIALNYLSLDNWTCDEAMHLIAGVLPEAPYGTSMGWFTIEGRLLHNDHGERDARFEKIRLYTKLWLSNPNHLKQSDPYTFLAWAQEKGIEIYWLEMARERGYLNLIPKTEKTKPIESINTEPVQRSKAQENAILNEIKKQNFSPLTLPINLPGKAGVKASVRSALLKSSTSQFFEGSTIFDKAWDRLRKNGEIANHKVSP
jgi:hypothetical protein